MLSRHLVLGLALLLTPGPAPEVTPPVAAVTSLVAAPPPMAAVAAPPAAAQVVSPPAAAQVVSPPVEAVVYAAPLAGALQVVRGFDPPTSDYGSGHRGVDLAAPRGSAVLAAAPGVVVYAGSLAGRLVVSIRHADGIRTTYEPLAALDVARGERVNRGARLGTLAPGHPGCLAGVGEVCLHWGALRGAAYLNPLELLDSDPIVLLPPVPEPPA